MLVDRIVCGPWYAANDCQIWVSRYTMGAVDEYQKFGLYYQ